MSVRLPFDCVCTFTHVLPRGMVIAWNSLFWVTWVAMHIMYLGILGIAMRHKRQLAKMATKSALITASSDIVQPTNSGTSEDSGVCYDPEPKVGDVSFNPTIIDFGEDESPRVEESPRGSEDNNPATSPPQIKKADRSGSIFERFMHRTQISQTFKTAR